MIRVICLINIICFMPSAFFVNNCVIPFVLNVENEILQIYLMILVFGFGVISIIMFIGSVIGVIYSFFVVK